MSYKFPFCSCSSPTRAKVQVGCELGDVGVAVNVLLTKEKLSGALVQSLGAQDRMMGDSPSTIPRRPATSPNLHG